MKNKNLKNYLKTLIFFAMAAVGAIIIFIGLGGGLIVLDIIGIALMSVGAVLGVLSMNKARMTCSKCGESMKGASWRYQTVSAEQKYNEQSQTTYNIYTFEVTAKCPHCGELKSFRTKRQLKTTENPQLRMDNYMRNLYGDEMLDD